MREQNNTLLLKQIREIHEASRKTYGVPRVTAELRLGLGLPVTTSGSTPLMRLDGIQSAYRRKGRRNLANEATEENLVHRQFDVAAPNKLWLADITEHPTIEGKVYCAAVMDAYSRLIIGWSIDNHLKTELVLATLEMAIMRRRPADDSTILHSDHGTQYTSWAFGKRLRDAGLLGPMGTVGDCYDNAMTESFRGTMQLELLDSRKWENREELAQSVFEWIECWYNPYRRHSSIRMHSPATFDGMYTSPDKVD